MIRTDIKVYGAKEAAASLFAMEQRTDKLQPVFLRAKTILSTAYAANFAANGLPSGKAWAPLDPEYGSWKARRSPGSTLIFDGRLFTSLATLSDSANRITGDSAQFGTTVEYAKFHQRGTRHMPKRQLVFEPPLFAKRIAEDTGGYVVYGRVV